MKLLDKRCSGYIEFDEFVDWWVNKVCICPLGVACLAVVSELNHRFVTL